LLDEPTNHLDAESVSWLERFLKDFAGTIVAITHDRYFLDNVAEWILELDRGHGIPYQGNYTNWLEQKTARLEQEHKQEEAFAKALKHELEWVRKNAKGQQAKSKARIERFEELNSREFQQRNETAEIYIPPGPRLGNKVVEVENISKSFGDRLLYEGLSFSVPPTGIVGIVGPNGAGKTTLFRMITGEDKPDTGSVSLGESVKVAYVGQMRDTLDASKTVWEEVSDGLDIITIGEYTTPSRAYIGRFNFKGQDQQKRVGELSGGERNRLQLAKTLRQGANVILLDEPSNDLDIETLRALEEAIQVFPGSVLVVSHDRWFLDRIATHILAFEDEGPQWFDGNYSEYEVYRKKTLGNSSGPKRAKYKKIGG
ncbi:MAG: energy-dependent translational throttle protein EttA, partial [Sphingobacteriales bacterium]